MIQVRKSVAEHLYVRLLTLDDHCCYQGCDLDMAQQVIPMLTQAHICSLFLPVEATGLSHTRLVSFSATLFDASAACS